MLTLLITRFENFAGQVDEYNDFSPARVPSRLNCVAGRFLTAYSADFPWRALT